MHKKSILILLFFFLITSSSYSYLVLDTGGVNTIIKKQVPKTPLQIMQESANEKQLESELPKGAQSFSKEQDSAFFSIVNLNLPVNVIIRNNLMFSDDIWTVEKRISQGTPWQVALQNVRNIPPEFYNPSPVELVHRQTMIDDAFYIPFVNTIQRYGLQLTTESIASFFGLTEDVSTKISYSLDFTAHVEVVVYSISSTVVATLFEGLQTPGNYNLTWNGRNSEGKIMPPGDYIAEVRIGNEKYIRKRILIR